MSRLAPIDKRIRDMYKQGKHSVNKEKWTFELVPDKFERFRCLRKVTYTESGDFYQEMILDREGRAKYLTREQAFEAITFLNKREAEAA